MAIDALSTAFNGAVKSTLTAPAAEPSDAAASGFGATLQGLVKAVDGSSADANSAIGKMIDGSGDVHEAMIALQRADVMLQLTVQIRNKLVQAYQDVMRMPV